MERKLDDVESRDRYSLTIGIECHISLLSSTKSFSSIPTSSISHTSLGIIGAVPQLNPEIIEMGLKLSKALNARISSEIVFERKSYFYFDLPRGYQISQWLNPIGQNGYFFMPNLSRKIGLKSICIEEDTAAYSKIGGKYTLYLERLGNPLIEISTDTSFNSLNEVIEFVKLIRFLCFFLKISRAEMEKGGFRVDLNLSLMDENGASITGRAEIKNLASYNSIEAAGKEMEKILRMKVSQGSETQFVDETYSWLEKECKLVLSREKKSDSAYYFVPESYLPVIQLEDEDISSLTGNYDQEDFHKLISEIFISGLAQREREEIISSYDFFWDCESVYKIVNNWAKSFYILKIFISEGGNELHFEKFLSFLRKVASLNLNLISNFESVRMRECCRKIINSEEELQGIYEFYIKPSEISIEEVECFCEYILKMNNPNLRGLDKKLDKLTSYLMGQVRNKFNQSVEMKMVKNVINSKLKDWVKKYY